MFEKVQKEHILQGIKDFEEKGYPNEFGPSSTYDLVVDGKQYPPKAIMAYANFHASGRKIERYFKGGLGTDCFKRYEELGFEVLAKNSSETDIATVIQDFLVQAKTGDLKTAHFPNSYRGLQLRVSFGRGVSARIPWICFFKPPNTVTDGIYPGILYYKEKNQLVLTYGRSETNESSLHWPNVANLGTIEKWYLDTYNEKPERYGSSHIKSVYDLNKPLDSEALKEDLDQMIAEYKAIKFLINAGDKKSLDDYLQEFAEVADNWFKEQNWFEPRYKFYDEFFKSKNIEAYDWEDFQKLGDEIHSFQSMAIAKGNALGKPNLAIDEYRRIFKYISSDKDPVNITINNLYKKYDGHFFLPYFSDSSISELIAYAFPNRYVTYNTRDVEALKFLGMSLNKVKKEKFGDKFFRYNELLKPVLEKYGQIVGKRTNTTLQLELDQFFSWLYTTKIKVTRSFDEVKAEVIEELEHSKLKYTPGKKYEGKNWFWVGDVQGIIGEKEAHYEVISRRSKVYIELHFESAKTKTSYFNLLDPLPEQLEWFKWNGAQSVRYKEVFLLNSDNIVQDIIVAIETIEELIGVETRASIEQLSNQSIFGEVLSKLNPLKVQKYFSFLSEIIDHFDLHPNDERLVFSLTESRLNLLVGQRYAWRYGENQLPNYGLLTAEKLSEKSEPWDTFGETHYWTMAEEFNLSTAQKESAFRGIKAALERSSQSSFRRFNNPEFEAKAFNIDPSQISLAKKHSQEKNDISMELNTILYGPPGTGKTFNTINYALSIIEGKSIASILQEDRGVVKKRYDELVKKGQVVFTTFHQSLSYEDFIEGIKPQIEETGEDIIKKDVIYDVQDGIFKELVDNMQKVSDKGPDKSSGIYIEPEKFTKNINKISLGNSLVEADVAIYNYCMQNDCISIGFGEDIDFKGVKTRTDIRKRYQDAGVELSGPQDFSISAIERLVLWMEPGQLVFVSKGTKQLQAIGEVTGEYFYDPNTSIRHSQFRKVKWLYKDLDIPVKKLQNRLFSQQSIYQMDPKNFDYSYFSGESKQVISKNDPHVLIIDEINRGNVSSIFGELITLIEKDKRKGNDEELEIMLPYSQEKFSVPNNLYIIGTMNTADRSVEALDTALRRRFSFIEMMPETKKLSDNFEGINLQLLLLTINNRVELLVDRDHTIGHSYFINLKTLDDLAKAFNDKIVPLLQEYFYGDYGKIGLVLGEGFVEIQKNKDKKFSGFAYEGKSDFITPTFKLIKVDKSTVADAVTTLLETEAKSKTAEVTSSSDQD